MEYEKEKASKGQPFNKDELHKFIRDNYILSSWFSLTLMSHFLNFLNDVRMEKISLSSLPRDEFVKTALKSVFDDLPETIVNQAMDPSFRGRDLDVTDCSSCSDKDCVHRGAFRRRPKKEGGLGLCPLWKGYEL